MSLETPAGEKHAWLGDAQDVAEEAFYNFWSVPVFELFLDTIRANQAVGGKCDGNLPMNVPAAIPNRKPDDISWTAAYPLITNWLYQYYGDLGAAKEHWPTLKRYMDGQRAQMADPEAARPHPPIGIRPLQKKTPFLYQSSRSPKLGMARY